VKVISGGQTGVDQVGLAVARRYGLRTGGTAPAGFRTHDGPNHDLGTTYGLTAHASSAYPPRTRANVRDSDGTVWFGNLASPGGKLTARLCREAGKPFISNPTAFQLLDWIRENRIQTLNVAGNRAHRNPTASERAEEVLSLVFSQISRDDVAHQQRLLR
jgi:hypothetical protein